MQLPLAGWGAGVLAGGQRGGERRGVSPPVWGVAGGGW